MRHRAGFTLLEALVSILVISIVMIGVQSLYVNSRTMEIKIKDKLDSIITFEEALMVMQLDAQSAYLQAPYLWEKTNNGFIIELVKPVYTSAADTLLPSKTQWRIEADALYRKSTLGGKSDLLEPWVKMTNLDMPKGEMHEINFLGNTLKLTIKNGNESYRVILGRIQ